MGRPPGRHPRAALLSLHARVDGVEPSTWDDPVARRSCGGLATARMSSPSATSRCSRSGGSRGRGRAAGAPRRWRRACTRTSNGRRMTDREVAGALGIGNAIRYAATTGTRRDPLGGRASAGRLDRRGLRHRPGRCLPGARSTLPPHLRADDRAGVRALGGDLPARGCCRVRRARGIARGGPIAARRRVAAGRRRAGDARRRDEQRPRASAAERRCVLPAPRRGARVARPVPEQRGQLWTSRVWPGALLGDGEIRGTWRRANQIVRISAWTKLSRGAREAVEAEARSLPLPGLEREIEVVWEA